MLHPRGLFDEITAGPRKNGRDGVKSIHCLAFNVDVLPS